MTDDRRDHDSDPDTARGDESQAARRRSAAAAATRRARRIAGPATTGTARPVQAPPPARTEPVNTSKPAAPDPTEAVTEAVPVAGVGTQPVDETVRIPSRPADRSADVAADTVDIGVPPSDPPGPSLVRWVPAAVLGTAAVIMAVLLATFSHSVWWAKPATASGQHSIGTKKGGVASTNGTVNEVRERVLAAAKQCVVATNKYDYRTFEADEAAGARCTTGEQTSRYRSAMENLIHAKATKLHASQVPQINTAGIESVTGDGKQWSIVVYGQLAIHTVNVKSRTDPFAAVVRMDYVDGKWLMADLQTLQVPGS